MVRSRLVIRNVSASRGRTSIRLEPEIWDALDEICRRERRPLGEIVQHAEERAHPGGRTSAVRIFAFGYFRGAATEEGHHAAGHGSLEQPTRSSAA